MRLIKIAKSRMSNISLKHGNTTIVAHLAPVGTYAPLCKATLPKNAYWVHEGESAWQAERDCKNCLALAEPLSDVAKR